MTLLYNLIYIQSVFNAFFLFGIILTILGISQDFLFCVSGGGAAE